MGSYRKNCVYKNFLRAVIEVEKSLHTSKVPYGHSNSEQHYSLGVMPKFSIPPESQQPSKQELVRFAKRASMNLAKKLNKANISFYAKPVHKELTTLRRQIKLLDILVDKFDKLPQNPPRSKVMSPINVVSI